MMTIRSERILITSCVSQIQPKEVSHASSPCELTLDDLRFSPSDFMSKIDKPTHRVYISVVHGTDGLKAVGTGLDNHKMCLDNNKTLLTSSMSAQHKPDGTKVIEGKKYMSCTILSRLSVRRPPSQWTARTGTRSRGRSVQHSLLQLLSA